MNEEEQEEVEEESLEFEWFEHQELPSEVLTNNYKYGFADNYSNIAALKVSNCRIYYLIYKLRGFLVIL